MGDVPEHLARDPFTCDTWGGIQLFPRQEERLPDDSRHYAWHKCIVLGMHCGRRHLHGSPTAQSEWTESIHDQILRLNDMTKQLVTLSRLDEGNTSNYPFAEFSLSKLASESVDSFAPTFKSKQLSFNSDIPSDINMKGNMYLINELFYIFFDNALKYTKSNGEVSLIIKKNASKKIDITFSNDVEDNEMDTDQLFERFYRSPNSVSKEGSGIGLSIAKEIVELHKGRINVSVKNGKIYFIIQL